MPEHLVKASTTAANVTAHIGHLRAPMLEFVAASDALVGCIAWLTDSGILQFMARRPTGLVIQKEDFLRPCEGDEESRAAVFRQRVSNDYAALSHPYCRSSKDLAQTELYDPESGESITAVLCAGNYSARTRTLPGKMHHKFLVRLRQDCETGRYTPFAVWTGSFNITENSAASRENAVVIHSAEIAAVYFAEWAAMTAGAERLDWAEPALEEAASPIPA